MFKRSFILGLVVALALVGVVAPVSASGASVQANETNATSGAETTAYVGAIDERTRIVDYSYSGGTFEITLESDVYQEIVLFDKFAGANGGEGFSKAPDGARREVQIDRGRTTLTFDVTEHSGEAAVDISTTRDGGTLWVQTSAIVFHVAATWGMVQMACVAVLTGGGWAGIGLVLWRTAPTGAILERVL